MKIQLQKFKEKIENNKSIPVILLCGSNQHEIMDKCDEAANLICGPQAEEEMRISKFNESALLKDTQNFYSKIKTVGFFPGKQVIIVKEATEKIGIPVTNILENWSETDATIILVAGKLKAASSLRKLIEKHKNAICLVIYDEQRDEKKIAEVLFSSKLNLEDQKVAEFLKNPHNFSSRNTFTSLIEKLMVYKFSDPSPVTFEEIELLFSDYDSGNIQQVIECLSRGEIENIIQGLKRLFDNGVAPNQILSASNNYFILLHKLSINVTNPNDIFNNNYPPIYGNRRQELVRQSRTWSTELIERALAIIQTTEKNTRLLSKVYLNSALERAFLRIASLKKRSIR